ncbi:MAG: hypothetical protein MK008_11535 [Bdellovibrionales bacterium]|nr:hypothetical protein [Bdellovibrionales bacterium]
MIKTLILFFLILSTPLWAQSDKPLLAMLTYNATDEHDVLQSLLCLEPCRGNDCTEEHQQLGEVLSNSFLNAVKPSELMQSDQTIEALNLLKPDFLSLSGHHSSGFSGSNGMFYFDQLSHSLPTEAIRSALSSPKVVLLNGCYTDVSTDFKQDPISYIEHVVTETDVREDTLSRFRSAISQISGFQKEYVNVFPQACIMGYEGRSIPGGIPQIYMQYSNYFRALYELMFNEKIESKYKILSGDYKTVEGQIHQECPAGQWPCNLCDVDKSYYSKFSKALAEYLKLERKRVEQQISHRDFWGDRFQQALQNNRFYKNTGWACNQQAEPKEPIIPRTLNRTKNAKLLFKTLFWLQESSLQASDKSSLAADAMHGIHFIKFTSEEEEELKEFTRLNAKKFAKLSELKLSKDSMTQYFKLAQKFECQACLGFADSQKDFNALSDTKKWAFAKALNGQSPAHYYKRVFQTQDLDLTEVAVRNLDPTIHKSFYKDFLAGPTEKLAVAAARSLGNNKDIPEEVLLWAINSPYRHARKITAYYISPQSSEVVIQEVLNSPHSEDFEGVWSHYVIPQLLQ